MSAVSIEGRWGQQAAMSVGVSIVIPASGASARFGAADKLLSPFDGVAMLRRVAQAAVLSMAQRVVVVCRGGRGTACREALNGLACQVVENSSADDGLSASIRTGISFVEDVRGGGDHLAVAGEGSSAVSDATSDGIAVLPGDLPLMRPDIIDALIARFAAHDGAKIVVPMAGPEGGQRNPVIWPRWMWPELKALSGDRGGKSLLTAASPDVVSRVVFEETAAFFDVDTADQLTALSKQMAAQRFR